MNDQKLTIDQMFQEVKNDFLPVDHPLVVCDRSSEQWKSVLVEYFDQRKKNNTDHYLIKDVKFDKNKN